MGRQSDLFERAAECERMIKLAYDPQRQKVFKELRDLWISLANESASFSDPAFAVQVERVEDIQSSLDKEPRNPAH